MNWQQAEGRAAAVAAGGIGLGFIMTATLVANGAKGALRQLNKLTNSVHHWKTSGYTLRQWCSPV